MLFRIKYSCKYCRNWRKLKAIVRNGNSGKKLVNVYRMILKKREKLYMIFQAYSQLTFTCSKSKIETLEKSVKYVES